MKKTKQPIIKNNLPVKDYQNLVHELKDILNTGLYTAYKAVDNIKVQTYWQIGERIVREELKYKDKADYGKYLIENLAKDLHIGRSLLFEIVKFYDTYPIVHALRGQLSWTQYRQLIKIDDNQKRKFYEQKSIQSSWGYRELHQQIKNNLYEKTSPTEIKELFQTKLPTVDISAVFGDTYYDFNFMDTIPLKQESKIEQEEKDLENLIINHIEQFLKELGEGFAFCGRQVPIKIAGQTHFVDLVLYNYAIPCTILVDLKVRKIDSQDIGQMNKYVAYYRQNRQYPHEKDAVGLIIGKEAKAEEIHYALDGLEEKIFIATYKAKLPSDEKIKEAVKKLS